MPEEPPKPENLFVSSDPTRVLYGKLLEQLNGQPGAVVAGALSSLVAWCLMAMGSPNLPMDWRVDAFVHEVRTKIKVAEIRGYGPRESPRVES